VYNNIDYDYGDDDDDDDEDDDADDADDDQEEEVLKLQWYKQLHNYK
jgi:hypothetical protein